MKNLKLFINTLCGTCLIKCQFFVYSKMIQILDSSEKLQEIFKIPLNILEQIIAQLRFVLSKVKNRRDLYLFKVFGIV